MSTGFPSAAWSGRSAAERTARPFTQRLDSQAGRGAGVGGRDAGAAGVGHDRHAIAGRKWLRGEQGRDVELLAHGRRADHARVRRTARRR